MLRVFIRALLGLSLTLFFSPSIAQTEIYGSGIQYEAFALPDIDEDGINEVFLKPYGVAIVGAASISTPIKYPKDPMADGLVISSHDDIYSCSTTLNGISLSSFCEQEYSADLALNVHEGAIYNNGSEQTLIVLNNSTGFILDGSDPSLLSSALFKGQNLSAVIVSDFNNDGLVDIVMNDGNAKKVLTYRNDDWEQYVTTRRSNINYVIGGVAGSFSANGGAAKYSIPIALPEGSGGYMPGVSVNYSSNGGLGIMGVGWSVFADDSAITRCGTDLLRDGFIDGVDLDSYDRLCFNGVRMVKASGTYGEDGAVYRLENNSMVRLTQYRNIDEANSAFYVEYKDGSVALMGGTSTNQTVIDPSDANKRIPIAWPIQYKKESKATGEDSGNKIRYHYSDDNNRLLNRVVYGGGKVEFIYSNSIERPRERKANNLGTEFPARPLLVQIRVF
ncbi:MAG: SpvB/TcaC N-terminal domain-containing protein, partial [Pseudomonadota bacterium]|nr:SpvB/TcaC N-terminal domain-containing protein [Pseudomonadota bacterium]